MENRESQVARTEPVLTRCQWGGWLAVSEDGSALKIGTVGGTEAEARQAFASALREWVRLLRDVQPDVDSR